MKKLLLFAGVITASAVSAQTFTVDDTSYTGLNTNYYVMDSNTVNLSAVTGTGVTWNYSSIWAYEDVTIPDVVVDASTSSFAGDFPDAMYNEDVTSGTSLFFSNSVDSITVYGYVITADGNEVIVKHNTDPLRAMEFPMAVGDTYSDVISGEIEAGGFPLPSTGTASVTVDGFGTLNVSGNTHANILRVKLIENIVGSITFPIPATGTVTRTVYYYYDLTNDPQAIFVHATITVVSDVFNDDYTAVYYSGTPDFFLGVEETVESATSIYPNPANSIVTIVNDGNVDVLNVINSLGQIVLTVSNPQTQELINVAEFTPGVYFVQTTKGGVVSEQKLVVE